MTLDPAALFAAPVYDDGVALEVEVAVPLAAPEVVVVVVFDAIMTKFAQVKRVVLLVWITTLLSPKKYGELGSVER